MKRRRVIRASPQLTDKLREAPENERQSRSDSRGATKNDGVGLETAFARIQQMLDPNSRVSHNRKLVDSLGNRRQYDVVIEGTVSGIPFLGIGECKDHNKKKGPDVVEAFATKCKYIGANLRIMVSRLGFTPQALVVAKAERIACLSLLPRDPDQTGLLVTTTTYHRVGRWDQIRLCVLWPEGERPELAPFSTRDVRYADQPVVNWFLKELATKYASEAEPGPLELTLRFDAPTPLQINGAQVESTGLSFRAERVFTNKRKSVRLYGDAVYDWQDKSWKIPRLGEVMTSAFLGDGSDFEQFDGDIPEGDPDFIEFMLLGDVTQFDPNMRVVDLTAL